jgi:hypothetical protein
LVVNAYFQASRVPQGADRPFATSQNRVSWTSATSMVPHRSSRNHFRTSCAGGPHTIHSGAGVRPEGVVCRAAHQFREHATVGIA